MAEPLLLAEFDDPARLCAAIVDLRVQGFRRLDAYTPYPVHEVEDALALDGSPVAWAVLAGGVAGAAGAYALQWLLVARLYPLNAGNRPPHFPLAFVPITFEMGILFAALAALLAVLVLGRLFSLWHPVFEAEGFEGASRDRHWLEIRGIDGERRLRQAEDTLAAHLPHRVVRLGDTR